MKKNKFFFLLVALLVMGKFSWAQDEWPKTWNSGGTTCTLTMDDHYYYALTVSVAEGQDGVMADYTSEAPAPWHEYVTDIHTLVIEEGVKEIGKWAFIQFNINSVTLPQSLRVIKTDAFRNSTMTIIYIPSTVTYIEAGAFHYCEQLYDVYCYAKAEDILWGGSNADFITVEYEMCRTTKMHVLPTRLAAFQSKYGTSLNVTFTAENMAPTDSWTDAGNYAESFSSAEGNTINIQNEAELARLAYLLNSGEQSFDQDGVINLAADLDLSAHYWVPIGDATHPFGSTFNGNGHQITDVYVNRGDQAYNGLFGYAEGKYWDEHYGVGLNKAKINDLVLKNSIIIGGDFTGGIVGRMTYWSFLTNVVCHAQVSGSGNAGGLIGEVQDASYDHLISGSTPYPPEIKNCLYLGNAVTGSNGFTGYIIGNYLLRYDVTPPCVGAEVINTYFCNNNLPDINDKDVRAYIFKKQVTVSPKVKVDFSGTGVAYNDVFYAPDSATVNFNVYCQDLSEVVNGVSVNGTSLGTTSGSYSYTVDASTATEYIINVTTEDIGFTGEGTAENPYIITTEAQWNTIAREVAQERNFSGQYLKLGNDISVSTMVGTSNDYHFNKFFAGNFNGDGHTLTFNCGTESEPFNEDYCAPFHSAKNAIITNLTVAGDIYTARRYAAGFVAESENNIIQDCLSSINIHSTYAGQGCHGGFMGYVDCTQQTSQIIGCVFNGSLLGPNTTKVGGFVGIGDCRGMAYGHVQVNDSFFVPTNITVGTDESCTFATRGGFDLYRGDMSFYTTALGTVQGQPCSTQTSENEIYRKHTPIDGETYYSAITITNLESTYYGDGNAINVNPTLKDAYDHTLNLETDYTLTIYDAENNIVEELTASGNYTLIISSVEGGNCFGSKTHPFNVVRLPGSGTADDPFIIATAEDWVIFANTVKQGNTYSGKYVSLTEDITVPMEEDSSDAVMVGTSDHPFTGTFTSTEQKTLTFNCGTEEEPFNYDYCAPFRYIDGATIEKLNIAGSIYIHDQYAGGLVAQAKGAWSIKDCVNSVSIHSTIGNIYDGFGYYGGFVGEAVECGGEGTGFLRCIFKGQFVGPNAKAVGGFVGKVTDGEVLYVKECLFMPYLVNLNPDHSDNSTIARGETSCDKVFYVETLGAEQGLQAYAYTLLPAGIGELIENNSFASFYSNGIDYDGHYYAPGAPVFFIVEGNWDEADNWSSGVLPTASTNVVIQANVTIPRGCLAEAGAVMVDNGYTLTIEDGGQLVHGNAGLAATVKKAITGVGVNAWLTASNGWCIIASPIVSDLAISSFPLGQYYDLYRLNDSTMMWENAKNIANNFTTLNDRTGYLYANAVDFTLYFTGELKPYSEANGDNEVSVDAGWNLIGNPFACNVYADRSFYKMNDAGTGIEAVENYAANPIPPCTGIVINAAEADSVSFTRNAPSLSNNKGNIQIALAQASNTRGNAIIDNAIVSFNEGTALPKFRFGDHAEIYIPQGNEDYAIVSTEAQGELPLNFKARENGTYTLTVSETANCQLSTVNYLHLIDNMTGADIDLLSQPAYTFQAKTNDYASRFRLVFAMNNEDNPNNNDNFAFESNGAIIVNGTGTLQVIDLLGHVLITDEVNSAFRIPYSAFSTGVYVLRLIDDKNVRTQKIVID